MKIRNPLLIKLAVHLGSSIMRFCHGTLRFDYQPEGADLLPRRGRIGKRAIYAFWHEQFLYPAFRYGFTHAHALISHSNDGQLLADIARGLGFQPVHGSSSRGGVEAIRQIVREGDERHVVVVPDGPRGPRRRVKHGILYLAARLGLPIIPVGFGYSSAWRAKSWDRLVVPKPFSRVTCVTSTTITLPHELERDDLERFQYQLEDEMNRLCDAAEQLATQKKTSKAA